MVKGNKYPKWTCKYYVVEKCMRKTTDKWGLFISEKFTREQY
jgi:hypothetical protein